MAGKRGPEPGDHDREFLVELNRAVGQLMAAAHADGGAVAMPEPGGFRIVEAAGLMQPLAGRTVPAGDSLGQRALGSAGPYVIEDVTESSLATKPLFEAVGAASALAIELPLGERGSCVLEAVRGPKSPAFTEVEALAATAVAGEAAARVRALELTNRLAGGERRLRAAEQTRSRFYGLISHELRTPLNAILCYGELLAEDVLGDLNGRQRDAVARVIRAARHLAELVDALLDLGDLDREDIYIDAAPVDVTQMVREVAGGLSPAASQAGLELRVDAGTDAVVVTTDPEKLRRVLRSLCSSALESCRGPVLSVSVRPRSGGASVRIGEPVAPTAAESAGPAAAGATAGPAGHAPGPSDGERPHEAGQSVPANLEMRLALAVRLAEMLGADLRVGIGSDPIRLTLPPVVATTPA